MGFEGAAPPNVACVSQRPLIIVKGSKRLSMVYLAITFLSVLFEAAALKKSRKSVMYKLTS